MKLILSVLLLLAPMSAVAADFTGTWSLDSEASQPMDAVLALQDLSWAKRKAANYLDNDVAIAQSGERMSVTFSNVLGAFEQVLVFNSQPHTTVNPAGMTAILTTRWDGETLVSTGQTTDGEGHQGTVTERRSISSDGQTMTLVVTVAFGGEEASVRRIFRRQ
ncbi:MAG: hypothetical protein ACI8RZ_006639 [Myxococcota bacterium]|jgi:hypothetical protein